MQKIIKVFNAIAILLPYLVQIVELYKNNKEKFELLFKKGDKEVIPPDREKKQVEEPVEEESLEKKK